MYSNIYCCSIHFLTLDAFNVNNILLPIDLHDLADLLTLVVTSNNLSKICIYRHCLEHTVAKCTFFTSRGSQCHSKS